MSLLIEPGGKLTIISEIHTLWYDGVRDMLDGPAEIVELCDGRALIVNEEFALRRFPLNVGATSLLQGKLSKLRERVGLLLAAHMSSDMRVLGPAILLDAAELKKINGE